MIGPDNIPVLGAAIGVGIGLAWTIVGANRDRAREVQSKELDLLQADLIETREAKMAADKLNAALEVQLARLKAERGP